jgi:hypothetical protein
MGLLGRGLHSPRLDEDTPTITTLVAAMAVESSGTYKIPKRWVSSLNMGKMHMPLLIRSYR